MIYFVTKKIMNTSTICMYIPTYFEILIFKSVVLVFPAIFELRIFDQDQDDNQSDQNDWDDKSKLANVKNGKLKCLKFLKTQFEIDLTEA